MTAWIPSCGSDQGHIPRASWTTSKAQLLPSPSSSSALPPPQPRLLLHLVLPENQVRDTGALTRKLHTCRACCRQAGQHWSRLSRSLVRGYARVRPRAALLCGCEWPSYSRQQTLNVFLDTRRRATEGLGFRQEGRPRGSVDTPRCERAVGLRRALSLLVPEHRRRPSWRWRKWAELGLRVAPVRCQVASAGTVIMVSPCLQLTSPSFQQSCFSHPHQLILSSTFADRDAMVCIKL